LFPLGFSRQGEFKSTTTTLLQKVHVENFFQFPKKSTKISMSALFLIPQNKKLVGIKNQLNTKRFLVFPQLLLFYHVFGCFSAMGVQKHTKKTFCKKTSCRKVFTKNWTENPKPIFSRFFLLFSWAFFGEGSSKTRLKKYRKK
jgi:hypothetical protein